MLSLPCLTLTFLYLFWKSNTEKQEERTVGVRFHLFFLIKMLTSRIHPFMFVPKSDPKNQTQNNKMEKSTERTAVYGKVEENVTNEVFRAG